MGFCDFEAARGALDTKEAVLSAQNDFGTVDKDKGEERGGVTSVSVGNKTSVGADSDVLSVAGNELDAGSKVLNRKMEKTIS